MTLLRVDSSARRNSVSRQLTGRFTESWKKGNPAGRVIERDLATAALPLITDEWTLAIHSNPATLTPISGVKMKPWDGKCKFCSAIIKDMSEQKLIKFKENTNVSQ